MSEAAGGQLLIRSGRLASQAARNLVEYLLDPCAQGPDRHKGHDCYEYQDQCVFSERLPFFAVM